MERKRLFCKGMHTHHQHLMAEAPDIKWIRIDDAFPKEQNRTSFTESNVKTLEEIYQLGRKSFGEHELAVREFFGLDNDPPANGTKPPATRSEIGSMNPRSPTSRLAGRMACSVPRNWMN